MRSPRGARAVAIAVAAGAAAFLLLAIPAPAPRIGAAPAGARGFVWHRDSLWHALEATFVQERARGCSSAAPAAARIAQLRGAVDGLLTRPIAASDPRLDTLEARFFALAPSAAACPALVNDYVALYRRMREAVKWQSESWAVTDPIVSDRLYRALYGGRAAVEEVVLQAPAGVPAILSGRIEPSASPAAISHGVELRSGDIIVSRGGYPTSALIARGSDYPGNFSHVALVYIDSATHQISVIEAHIELGVAVSSFEKYLGDKKLRLMLLRPRADLPALRRDPLLPHRAAGAMLARARSGHIPYDFQMDYKDPSRLFCSEVASAAYHASGVDLWMRTSTISTPGLRRWLASFGVTHFETQEPSDLEYDPQLVVVAEWRDLDELFRDHIDNAVTDAMLEGAERGDVLSFPWYELPVTRLAKGYSVVLEWFGRIGPVPEGMSASAALRNRAYSARHARLAAAVGNAAGEWIASRGYRPMTWDLLDMARTAAATP